MPEYKEIACTTACNRLKRNFPFSWDLNIYRGCEHGCQYCYAIYVARQEESSLILSKKNIL